MKAGDIQIRKRTHPWAHQTEPSRFDVLGGGDAFRFDKDQINEHEPYLWEKWQDIILASTKVCPADTDRYPPEVTWDVVGIPEDWIHVDDGIAYAPDIQSADIETIYE